KRNREHLEAMKSGQSTVNPIATRIVALEKSGDEGRSRLAALQDKLVVLKRTVAHALEPLAPR
ncbi:MAG TPA: hypothetical protein VHU80_05935, partial [Polyangiaceae bacterium]|nr:hypothetical protein [Polyangiaceae bacterium]